jgi:hypothetical protein
VIQPSCGSTINSRWTVIYAQQVTGAQGYKFVVTNGAQTREFVTPNSRFQLQQLAGGAAANTNGSLTITFSGILVRQANLLEVRNFQNQKFIVDHNANVGINISSINNSGFQLDVNGNARSITVSTQGLNISSINGVTLGSFQFTGSTTQLSAAIVNVSSLSSAYTLATQSYISSLQVDSIQIGTGTGWIDIGPIQATEVSTLQLAAGNVYAANTYLGTRSTQTAIQYFGLNGTYQNSIIAERSTGTTTQELLLFKGSSSSDQIRVQTTGNFLLETGVSARVFPNMGQVTTPSLYVNTSGQVGIGTSNPSGYTLNVAGTGYFATSVSTQTLYAGTIYYSVAFV